jgi:tetratricopeptide (TPR) repeat protein
METRFVGPSGLGVALGLLLAVPVFAADVAAPPPRVGDLRKVGTVRLVTSCAASVRTDFERATALLHSFFYDEARRSFADVAAKDPKCAMAHWGVAMSWWHPIWAAPTSDDMKAGQAAIAKAKAIGGGTPLERGYIAALDQFYATPASPGTGEMGQSCHGPTGGGDHPARAAAYEKAMATLFEQHPDDVEVATFYALGLLGSASPTDQTLQNQTRATAILEPFYLKYPDHPGVVHYLIHGYDYPSVAAKGLVAAKAYAEIAPWVPHALHMPAHIFVRLGMWDDVIQSNLAAADAARQYAARNHPDAASFEELHSYDYLIYAYLQTGQDALAKDVMERAGGIRKTVPAADLPSAYATGAVPARYALERRQWGEAAALQPLPSPSWVSFPVGAGHVAFARALGAARLGHVADARQALRELEQVAARMTDPRQQYFARQTEMQVHIVQGWLAFVEGRRDEAERMLREAADTDDALGKSPVSPGTLLPAREILADFLLERSQPEKALAEYEACLKLNPGRLNSLYGAGRAAEQADILDKARLHFRALGAMAVKDADRPEIAHARKFLAEDCDCRGF